MRLRDHKTIDEVDVRAAQYVIGHECPAGDASKIERGHCAWCNAYWLIEDMWHLHQSHSPLTAQLEEG